MRTEQRDHHPTFEVTKQARREPQFVEENADEYFAHFERTAVNLGWPKITGNVAADSVDR